MLPELRRTVRRIPKGKVSSYGAVARAAGFPGRARQVVWALRVSEPGLPWHRVVGAGGKILLPGDNGLEQRLRLRQEGVTFQGDKVAMKLHEFTF
jgi:methylated-DNA-protein-cysteine methyltransferase related protein